MQFLSISALSFAALSLIACGGNAPGAPESTTDDNVVAQAEAQSPHSQEKTAADAWKDDEPVPAEVEGTVYEEPAGEEADEDAVAEDPSEKQASNDVGQAGQALSTSYGTTFNLTYYWVANRPSGDPNQVTIRDCSGNFLTYASYAWRDQVRMEMTGRFTKSDGTKVVFNDAGGCWKKMSSFYDWGMGVPSPISGNSYKLRPFRAIAVDKSVLQIGKWYYIPQLDGVKMPSPRSTLIHNGCVRAVDVGYGIFGKHIDFFSGLKSAYSTLINGSSKMGGRTSVTVYDGAAKCGIHIERGY